MVQIYDNPTQSIGERLSQGLQRGLDMGSQLVQQKASKQKEQETYKQLGIDPAVANLPEEARKEYFKNAFTKEKGLDPLQQAKLDALKRNEKLFENLGYNLQENQPQNMEQQPQGSQQPSIQNVPDEMLDQISAFAGQPGEQGILGNMAKSEKERRKEQNKLERENLISDRDFHTGYSKKAVDEVDAMRESLPRVQMSLDFARDAVESNQVGALSLANLGEKLGLKELQTARGSQLITAAKENLIGTVSRVSAKAQNQWMEQRINSMFAQIGKSEEANLAGQEILEAEFAMNKAYLSEFDRIQDEDTKNYGYERKDIKKRAQQAVAPLQQHIFDRAAFRILELQEKEEGLKKLKEKVGKNVIKGTFLTPVMTKLYVDKYGDKDALIMAEKNGYRVPSLEEFKSFQSRPQEFRQGLENE